MQHQQVIEKFISEGSNGRGAYVKANDAMLYSEIPQRYAPWGRWSRSSGQSAPLAVRLKDNSLLVNGARLPWPISGHQTNVLEALQRSTARFGVVPFHSIIAAWTDGTVRDWSQKPIPTERLQKDVEIVVPSSGERYREISETDKHGHTQTRRVHTLGDSVVRIRNRYYLSAVDETGSGWAGMYFLVELLTDQAPRTLADAFQFLKPQPVREAEARGANVRRQGEWFAIPTMILTSKLMRDVERGLAVHCERHILGRDGHHQIEEAIIYRHGPQKGEVYARGMLKHTAGEHTDLDLGSIRWHLLVHNVAGQSYTLSGTQAQFD